MKRARGVEKALLREKRKESKASIDVNVPPPPSIEKRKQKKKRGGKEQWKGNEEKKP